MSKAGDLKLYSTKLSATAWFYEDRGHVKVVAKLRTPSTSEPWGRRYMGTTHTSIPMRLLCRVVDRYRRAKRGKK